MRFVVSCFLVVNQKIIAFELYRPFIKIIWGKSIDLDYFIRFNKSFVANLYRYTYVSYKYIKGSEIEDQND
jgi:hypothetical protein